MNLVVAPHSVQHVMGVVNLNEAVKLLISWNFDSSKCTENGESPLNIATEEGHTEIVEYLKLLRTLV